VKKFILLLFAYLVVSTAIFPINAADANHTINPVDRDYLIKAVAASYPDVSFGARVAIAAVVVNRVKSPDYPDTAAGAIVSLGDMFNQVGSAKKISPEILRLTADAVDTVLAGADPTGGCTSFVCHERVMRGGEISARTPLDLFFNDYSEENIKHDILTSMSYCKVIIDGIGFY